MSYANKYLEILNIQQNTPGRTSSYSWSSAQIQTGYLRTVRVILLFRKIPQAVKIQTYMNRLHPSGYGTNFWKKYQPIVM
jgi:hypothetical protein